MTQADFTHILQKPQELTHEQTDGLKSILEKHPYFQAARAIYLKGLKDQSSLQYNKELKITAAYTTDRSILFDFITSEVFFQNEISETIKNNSNYLGDIAVEAEDLSINKKVSIDDRLNQQINDTDGVLDPALFEPKEPRPLKETPIISNTPEKDQEKQQDLNPDEKSAEAILELGKPLPFNKQESHSFNEWLQLTRFQPIEREPEKEKLEVKSDEPSPEPTATTDLEKEKKFKLIDKFIAENPKISPTKPLMQKGNLAQAQMIQPEALMTETLARIYVEQKNFKKAIQSYKILSLKYPEKSSFFANQIKAVEQLQEQNNK
ncbi:hypothetical protein JJL45_15950 [Tamlana sp. s12]|uniref:hypothetical protein n=1 Tax=Tamlana sp. s12 TaxID=1630406 RepID=UPI0007FD8B2F|nr:hypothetical protein [Tamlana sp. s12]OBQ57470.1 hypothetical protein VQ01_02820 [Tamlana sp. s12]QQY82379.1 hypothetical protein JJL45_15950 [Tamlana sp. s12]